MKKFMSKISALCLTVLAGAMFTGCSNSEEVTPQTEPQTGKFTLTVVAEKQGGTRALAIGDVNNDGNADIVATWTAGDEVQVYDATTGTALTGTLTAESSGASTRLTGTVEGTLSQGDELKLTYLSDDYSGQDGTLQYIAQHCDYAEATVTVGKVEAGVITPTGTASFANAQAIAKFMLTEVTGAGINAESLTVGYGSESLSLTIPAATYTTNGDGVLYVALPPFAQQTVSLTATVGDDTYTYTTSGVVSLEAGQFQPIAVMMRKEVVDLSGEINGRAYVDLGLPSGTLWATCNIGANSPEDYGLYFAWGETTGYTGDTNDGRSFDWTSYIYSVNAYTTLTKYCNDSGYGYNGFTDNLTELELGDDAAYVNWGSEWRMPSDEQFQELVNSNYTTTEWVAVNGVYGRLITSKMAGHTHKSIFMPAAGYRYESTLTLAGSGGSYYSRTLNTSEPYSARGIYLNENNINAHYGNRYRARSIRPVRGGDEQGDDDNAIILNLFNPITFNSGEGAGLDVHLGDVNIQATKGIKSVMVKAESTNPDMVESLIAVGASYGLDFVDAGVEVVGNTDLVSFFSALGKNLSVPAEGDPSYDFPVGNFFTLLNVMSGTHTFNLNVTDQDGNRKSGSVVITVNE